MLYRRRLMTLKIKNMTHFMRQYGLKKFFFFLKSECLETNRDIRVVQIKYKERRQTNAAPDLLLDHSQSNGYKGTTYGQGRQLAAKTFDLVCLMQLNNQQLMKFMSTGRRGTECGLSARQGVSVGCDHITIMMQKALVLVRHELKCLLLSFKRQ